MRKRRQVLQVSTFPFLAVLLCAMGSLILLLLVIDRRAHVAARARAMQAQQQAASANAKERERRQAEMEQRRREREELAKEKERQIVEQVRAAQQKADSARQNLDNEERRYRDLQKRFQTLRGRLVQTEQDVAEVETEAEKAGAAADASRAERLRLTEQLAQLEGILTDLKALREREKHTYSLVPYHGKRGQSHKPIYVECQGEAVVFHPDAKKIAGLELGEPAIRREVEDRIARQRAGHDPPARGEAPYLFLLVRPEGVQTYYLVQNSLMGLQVEFGYEFVDAGWALDFSGNGDRPAPWKRVEGSAMKLVPNGMPPERVEAGGRRAGYAGGPTGMPTGGGGGGGVAAFAFPGMELLATEGSGRGGGGGVPGVGPFALAGAARGTGASFVPPGIPGVWGGGGGSPSGEAGKGSGARAVPGATGPGSGANAPPDTTPGGSMGGPHTGSPPDPGGIRSAAAPGLGQFPARGVPAQGPYTVTPAEGTLTLGPISPGEAGIAGQGGAPAGVPVPPGTVMNGPPSGQSVGVTGKSVQEVAAAGQPGMQTGGGGYLAGTPGRGTDADSAPAGPPTPLLSPPTLPGAERARGTSQPSPAPVLRKPILNRDWVIPIECRADGVLLIPGRVRFSGTALAPTPNQTHPLAQAVQQLIGRRQATVPAGDPPYRPRILFQVRPEGLRAYYLAYPLLEGLRLPMARENVSARTAASNNRTSFDP